MNFDFYKSLIDQASKGGVCSVKLQYLGEPLLHLDLAKQIRYAKSKRIIEVMINTNAVALTEEISREILKAGVDSMFFSVDYLNKEKYSKIRVGADLDRVIKNIKKFVEIKNELNCKHVQTRVSKVVFPGESPEELEKFKSFWFDKIGIDLIGFDEFIDFTSPAGEKYNPNFVCAQPFQRMVILWDGRVLPCCGDVEAEYIVGDATKEKLDYIWQGEKYKKLRERHIAGRYYEMDICRKCYLPLAKWGR